MKITTSNCRKHGALNEENAKLNKDSRIKDGWRWRCNECSKSDNKKWRTTNLEKHRNNAKRYQQENTLDINRIVREDRKKNPEKYREYERRKKSRDSERYETYYIKQRYGITKEQYDEMVARQNNRCSICLQPEKRKGKRSGNRVSRLSVDHCHRSLKVRDLLCHDCNTGIGKFKDDIELMMKAIEYLRKHSDG